MSGICGIVFQDKKHLAMSEDLWPMVKALTFSGRSEGLIVRSGRVAMGAKKFSGRLTGVSERIVNGHFLALAFHGSLYNLDELLSQKFEEVDLFASLLRLYIEGGIGFLNQLRGDFSLAIWDNRTERLYLATDRFRVHPLFYYQDKEKMIFGSRMKAIKACPLPVKKSINPEAVVDVIGTSIIPTPKTIFREVNKIPPGHFLVYQRGKIKIESYWKTSFLHQSDARETVLARQFRGEFSKTLSLFHNVEKNSSRIGTFLSGGIDSSSVTGVLKNFAAHPVKSFSIGFGEESYNEIHYARIAAKAFGADHYEYFVTPQDTYNVISTLTDAFDEPYGNASAISTYFCAKLALEHGVDILYAGDGGDELFAGNQRYAEQQLFECYHKIPKLARKLILKPLIFTLADFTNWNALNKGKKYILRASIPYHERASSYEFFNFYPIGEFIEEDLLNEVGTSYNPYSPFSSYYLECSARSKLERHLYADWKLTISDNDLIKFRMAEVLNVSIRFPYLDRRIVEFSVKVPAKIKMHGTKLRTFQKKAFADLLPSEIRGKKKHGFGLPIANWLRTDRHLNEMMHDLVLSPRSIQRGYFRKKALEGLVESNKTENTAFYGVVLWNLMVLELWHRKNYEL